MEEPDYLLFIGDAYYPSGGAEDLAGHHEDLEAAIAKGREYCTQTSMGWWHVYSITRRTIVAKGGGPYGHPGYGEEIHHG